jgi:uncharacterized protein
MQAEDFAKFFDKAPERFPRTLQARYPWVLDEIVGAWERPVEARKIFLNLVVDLRGNRAGFPKEAMQEILFLANLYYVWVEERKKKADPVVLGPISKKRAIEIEANMRRLSPAELSRFAKVRELAQSDASTLLLMELDANGWDANQCDEEGKSPMAIAAQWGAARCISALAERQGNPHVKDRDANAPLHWAVARGHLRCAETLLFFGADPDERNRDGKTPLHLAAIKSDSRFARRLLDYGADPRAVDRNGDSALHFAVNKSQLDVVQALADHGAQEFAPNKEGFTPEQLARSKGFDAASRLFEQKKMREQAIRATERATDEKESSEGA